MALNGYVTAEERRSRLILTSRGFFVVIVRQLPKPWPGINAVAAEYAVFRDGVLIAWLYKINKWGVSGYNGGFKTRKEAIEFSLTWRSAGAEAAKAQREYALRGAASPTPPTGTSKEGCQWCCSTGRFSDHACRICGGSGVAKATTSQGEGTS